MCRANTLESNVLFHFYFCLVINLFIGNSSCKNYLSFKNLDSPVMKTYLGSNQASEYGISMKYD